MAKRKKKEGLGFARPTRDLVVGASVLGIGATVVSRTGGSTAGISAAASFLPVLGVTVGGGLALRQLRRLQGQERVEKSGNVRRRRKRRK